MVHWMKLWRHSLGAVLLMVTWIAAGEAPMASPDEARCRGCSGITGYGDEAYAPPPCAQSPYGTWSVAISCDVFEGACVNRVVKDVPSCLGSPCETTVTYSWGSEVADADLEIGYRQTHPIKGPDTTYAFGGKPPWKKGKTGSVTYDPGVNPNIACGDEITYFINGNLCGAFEASVFGQCSPCKVPIVKLPPKPKLTHGSGQ